MLIHPSVLESFEATLNEFETQTSTQHKYVVGFSGGLDSTVLLHLLLQSIAANRVEAWHLNHALQATAAAMEQHCRALCSEWGVAFHSHKLEASPEAGCSIEAWARKQRYGWFEKRLQDDQVLLTAHHADDQAETLLLQLLRGRGPRGLASIAPHRALGAGALWRPLLNLERQALQAYAEQHELVWVEDPSNGNERFDRNYLRHQVIPLLKQRWPGLNDALAHASALQQQQLVLNAALADNDLKLCEKDNRWSASSVLQIDVLLQWPVERQRNAILHWLAQKAVSAPAKAQWQRIHTDILRLDSDHRASVQLAAGVVLRSYRKQLFVVVEEASEATPTDPQGIAASGNEKWESFELMRRQQVSSEHLKQLKKLFQREAVPPWVRDSLWLICEAGKPVGLLDG